MKSFFLGLALLCFIALGFAAPPANVEQVQMKGGKVFTFPGGQPLTASNGVSLPFDIVVKTNGTFTVQAGKPRSLAEGELLNNEGMLIRPDGTIMPVMNHVTFNKGRVIVFRDGQAQEAIGRVTLANGTSIEPDGKINPRGANPRLLLDGEIFLFDGSSLPVRDTIIRQNGQVKVQKDGSVIPLPAGRSIMMNDGTKVYGDGRIVKRNGEEMILREGQIITLQGVLTRPR